MTLKNTHRHTSPGALSRKAALVQTTITAVVVLIFSLAIIFFNTYRLNAQVESKISGVAALAETSLASAVWQVDHASARDFIDAVFRDQSVVFAQVVTGHETMAARTRPQYAGQPFSYFQNQRNFTTRIVEIRKFGDWIGTFNLAVSKKTIRHDVMVNAGGTLVLALVLIIIISQTTLYFSRKKLFVPLKRLEESATAIADGDLNAEIDTLQPGELGSLARATDDMRESVRHLIKDLKEANTRLEDHKNSLENTVKIRTDELKRKNVSLNQALEDVQNAKKGAEVANLAKSRFLASMSHEIRTPMNAILGMADILWETPLTEDQARYVQVFRTAGESLLEILDDILDLSKIEAGHLTLEKTIFSLDEVLGKACTIIEPQAEDKGLAFAYSIAPGIPDRLEGDPTRLKQILINLLGNAIKFTKSGTVQMAVEQAPGHNGVATLQFSVEDTGIGIPADKLSTIFDSFTQADSSTTRQFGGTGLGLAISMQLVRMMGGRIWAESSLGSGSTFHFTTRFGIVNKSGPTPPENTVHFDSQQNVPGLNILMVEDSKYNAFVIQTYLKSTLCQLTIVENGLDGFEEFKKGDFDCILMDIQMPVMDGYETTRAIRAWEQANGLDSIFIVAMTAYALTGDSEKCIQAGADFHLPKPVKKSRLFEILTGLDQKRHTPTASTKATTPPSNMKLAELKKAIIATYTAIDQKDLATVEALGNTFRQMGTDRSMDTLKEYGDALLQAAKEGAKPDRIRQILTVLSEYVERMDTL